MPFLPRSLPERLMTKAVTLKTCDSAQAPFETRDRLIADYVFVLLKVTNGLKQLAVCVGVRTVPVFQEKTPQAQQHFLSVSHHLAQMPCTGQKYDTLDPFIHTKRDPIY